MGLCIPILLFLVILSNYYWRKIRKLVSSSVSDTTRPYTYTYAYMQNCIVYENIYIRSIDILLVNNLSGHCDKILSIIH